jgi:hypothetical protein
MYSKCYVLYVLVTGNWPGEDGTRINSASIWYSLQRLPSSVWTLTARGKLLTASATAAVQSSFIFSSLFISCSTFLSSCIPVISVDVVN